MLLEGSFSVKAGLTEVYDFLTDPAKFSSSIPDVREVKIEDPDNFTVKVKVGVSRIKGTMVVKLRMTGRNPPIGTTVVGKGAGLGSVVDMVTSFVLGERERETIVNWTGNVNVAGTLAAFGPQGLLDRLARKNIEKFIAGVKKGIESLAPA